MKNIVLFLFLLSSVNLTGNSSKKDSLETKKRELSITGTLDERLTISLLSYYVSNNDENKACVRKDFNTGSNKKILTVRGQVINSKLPIDLVDKSACKWDYSSSKIKIYRKHDDGQKNSYSKYVLLSAFSASYNTFDKTGITVAGHSPKVTAGGHTGVKGVGREFYEVPNKYFFLGKAIGFRCETEYYYFKKLKREATYFWCSPTKIKKAQGLDELKSMSINLDIFVDESKYKFVPYKLSRYEKIKLYLNELFAKNKWGQAPLIK